jgi:arylformamidase
LHTGARLSSATGADYVARPMRIYDISQPLGTDTAVWPGDRRVEVAWPMRRERGDPVNVATVTTSVHAGTHADGFLHFQDNAETAASMPLEAYIGRCLVVDARGHAELGPDTIAGVDLSRTRRVLFRTRETVDAAVFPARYAHVAPALAHCLAGAGVLLLGTDAPSVDPVDSKTLESHHALGAGRVAIVENLVLSEVAAGEYTLIALPLRLVEADSSPVRAVLIEGDVAAGR